MPVRILIALLLLSTSCFAQPVGGTKTWIEEADGSPSIVIYKIIADNGTVTDNADGTGSLSSGGGHDAVTLGTDADVLLGLSTQQLILDSQAANLIFAGPGSGAAADPTFRSLVDDDVPNTITASNYQLLDTDLTAIAALGFTTTAFLKKTGADTWALDTNVYLTSEVDGSTTNELPTAGTYIDVTGQQVDVDLTEIEAAIFGAGGNASNIWTFNLSGTDPTMTFNSGALAVGGALSATGAVTGSNLSGTNTGDNTTATTGDSATSFFPSGTLEVAIGGTGTTTSTGTGSVVLGTSPTFTTSIALPQGAAPTVDAAGEIAQDTTDDQLLYGATPRVLAYEQTRCIVIENLAAADDNYPFGMFNDAVTITGVGVHCDGTCTTAADIDLSDRAGNAMTHSAPTVSTTTGSTTFTAVTAANTLTAGEGLELSVANAVSPETDEYTICYTYTYDRQ